MVQGESIDGTKKIIFFLGSMSGGGAERVISILSREYASKGWQTDIGVLLFYRLGYKIDRTTRLIDFTGNTESRIKRVPYWISSIRQYVKREDPDVIISFAARINALVQLACLGLHKKIIVSERADPRHDGRELPIKILNNIFYPKAHRVVFQTRRAKSFFNKKIQKNSMIILNPIMVEQKAVLPPNNKIVTVGRCSKEKNHKMLIEAFAEIAARHPEYELWIYGDGELREEQERLCGELGISERVMFPGNVPDVHRQIADAEIFVLSSDHEGLSNALMEAMQMGLPCISTDCGGADEIIADGENGLLVPVGDKGKLIEAMEKLMGDKELERQIGKNAERDSGQFDAEVILRQWDEVISS